MRIRNTNRNTNRNAMRKNRGHNVVATRKVRAGKTRRKGTRRRGTRRKGTRRRGTRRKGMRRKGTRRKGTRARGQACGKPQHGDCPKPRTPVDDKELEKKLKKEIEEHSKKIDKMGKLLAQRGETIDKYNMVRQECSKKYEDIEMRRKQSNAARAERQKKYNDRQAKRTRNLPQTRKQLK